MICSQSLRSAMCQGTRGRLAQAGGLGDNWRHEKAAWLVVEQGCIRVRTAGPAVVLAVTALPLRAKGGVPDAVNLAALATFALSIPPLVASLWSWYRRSASPVPVTSADLAAAKDVLAGLVEQQWQAEAVLRSLDDPDPMPVQWHVAGHDAVMDRPANLTPGSLLLTASSDAIAALVGEFRAMRRRRLVILGGPGTGKTTLAVLILRELLATRSLPAARASRYRCCCPSPDGTPELPRSCRTGWRRGSRRTTRRCARPA